MKKMLPIEARQKPMDALNREIVLEVYHSLALLGADFKILCAIGSWGSSLPDHDVLSEIRAWNSATMQDLKERIEYYETSPLHCVCSPSGGLKTSAEES